MKRYTVQTKEEPIRYLSLDGYLTENYMEEALECLHLEDAEMFKNQYNAKHPDNNDDLIIKEIDGGYEL